MQNPSVSVRLTYRDLLALPDDLLRHELIDGEHHLSTPLLPGLMIPLNQIFE
jgi:hypothetical protein